MSRIKALSAVVRAAGADAVLLTSEVGLIYATGVTALEGQCLIFADDTASLVTDGRYIEIAEQKLIPQGFRVINRTHEETSAQCLSRLLTETGAEHLLYEDNMMTVQEFALLRRQLAQELLPLSSRLTELRACKSEEEIAAIVKAQRIAEAAYAELLPQLYTGITEREAAAKLNYLMACKGSEKPSFETIMLFGENTSKPHGTPSDRALRAGDFITMDFGAVVEGYHSDMTRTVAYGYATDEMRAVYETVLAAQAAAQEAARAGTRCCDMHFAAARVIEDAGYGKYFTHALGHSVGLEIHESPAAAPRCTQLLKDGVVMTDEPGIYMAGKFGVRIEDMLVIDGNTPRNLTQCPKALLILPERNQ